MLVNISSLPRWWLRDFAVHCGMGVKRLNTHVYHFCNKAVLLKQITEGKAQDNVYRTNQLPA